MYMRYRLLSYIRNLGNELNSPKDQRSGTGQERRTEQRLLHLDVPAGKWMLLEASRFTSTQGVHQYAAAFATCVRASQRCDTAITITTVRLF